MAKTYSLDKSAVTGWWVWSCNNGLTGGSATNKEDAKKEAEKACGSGFVLTPPPIDMRIYRGHLATFTVANLEGERVTFSAGEISGDLFQYLFGAPGATMEGVQPASAVVALLKMWGIYRGGVGEDAVRKHHALSADMFGRLAKRNFKRIKLTVAEDGQLKWSG